MSSGAIQPIFTVVPIAGCVTYLDSGEHMTSVLVRSPTATEQDLLASCSEQDQDRLVFELVCVLTGLTSAELRGLAAADRYRIEAVCASRFSPQHRYLTDPDPGKT